VRIDAIIQFAQDLHGTDAGQAVGIPGRAPVPDWVTPAAEHAIVADGDHTVRIESEGSTAAANPVTDTSVPDVLAFYLPFHFYKKAWGIYVRVAGVCALAERLRRQPGTVDTGVLDFAYRLLLEHERFHFFTEYAASRQEVVTGEPCYRERTHKELAGYFQDQAAACHEEALANAHAIHACGRHDSGPLLDSARAWMLTQPEGYRDFKKWLPPAFDEGRRQAAGHMSPAQAAANRLLTSFHPAEFLFFRVNPRRSPVRIVLDADLPWLRVAKPFPVHLGLQVHVRTNDPKPAHTHIDCPPGTPCTRYLWPELTPFPGDARLRSSRGKALRYVPPVFDELFVRPRERCCCAQRRRCKDHAEDQDGDPGAPVFLRPPRRRRAMDS